MKFAGFILSIIGSLLCISIQAHPSRSRSLERRGDVSSFSNSVPLNDGGNQSLPAPTTTLKYITLGRGTQNYTCASPSATPKAVGAKAILWDVSALLKWIPAPWGLKTVLNAPRLAIDIPIEDVPSFIAAEAIGHHIFNSAGQPTFDLGSNGFLIAKKVGDIPAPSDAVTGPIGQPSQDYGAVDWLKLVDAGGSVGLSAVYRVECAGGKPPTTCPSSDPLYQEYSCLYWFYG